MIRIAALSAAAMLLLCGCATLTLPTTQFRDGEVFSINLGESATNADGSVVIRFDGVTGDSRCQPGAYCIWAGQLTVRIGIAVRAAPEQKVELNSVTVPREAMVSSYRVELIEAQAPAQNHQSSEQPTRVHLRVTPMP